MPILLRKPGESMMISDNLIVTVLEVNGDQVRFGLDYINQSEHDNEQPDMRAEVYAKVYDEVYERSDKVKDADGVTVSV